MINKSERAALRGLITGMPPAIEAAAMAEEDALRLLVRLGLEHPMTLAAALRVVATEMPHGRIAEIAHGPRPARDAAEAGRQGSRGIAPPETSAVGHFPAESPRFRELLT